VEDADPGDSVDGWMTSRGHRYNLMYADHTMGAIGCYGSVCAFMGVNDALYGLGKGECISGEEGLAYWSSVPARDDEVVQT